jgi:hypothetical protein
MPIQPQRFGTIRSVIIAIYWRVLVLYAACHLLEKKSLDFVQKEWCPRHLPESFSTVNSVPSVGISLDYVPSAWCPSHLQETFKLAIR